MSRKIQIFNLKLKHYLVVCLFFTGLNSFGQLLHSQVKNLGCFCQVNGDSAHVMIFRLHDYFTRLVYSETLSNSTKKGDTLFSGEKSFIIKRKADTILLWNNNTRQKPLSLQLKKGNETYFNTIRKNWIRTQKQAQFYRLKDSLNSPYLHSLKFDSRENVTHPLPYVDYENRLNFLYDSLSKIIIAGASPGITAFYRQFDSIDMNDTSRIYALLNGANYNLFYNRYLLKHIALKNPGILIKYIDTKQKNSKATLKAIRNHESIEAITNSVELTPLNCKGKKKIVKQMSRNKLGNAGAAALYFGIIAAEIALLVAIIVLIAR